MNHPDDTPPFLPIPNLTQAQYRAALKAMEIRLRYDPDLQKLASMPSIQGDAMTPRGIRALGICSIMVTCAGLGLGFGVATSPWYLLLAVLGVPGCLAWLLAGTPNEVFDEDEVTRERH